MCIRFVGTEAEEKARTERLKSSSVECSSCHARRMWGLPCPHCKQFIGSMEEGANWIVESFKRYSPEQQQKIREDSMRECRASLAKHEWEQQYPGRPYDSEPRN